MAFFNAKWHFSMPNGIFQCQISQVRRFLKAFGRENYHLAKLGEKCLATVFSASSKFRK